MLAVLQMADEPQIMSTAVMLRVAGYDRIMVCGPALRDQLKRAGCDTVLAVEQMVRMGYDPLDSSIPEATPDDMKKADLFVEIKVRNVPKITANWAHLKGRVLYWRVNGAQPEICPKGGDEVNLPCPIVTACLWYGLDRYRWGRNVSGQDQSNLEHLAGRTITEEQQRAWAAEIHYHDTESNSYVFWPPYPRSAEYDSITRSTLAPDAPPYCLAHSAPAWGFRPIVDDCVKLGIKVYGDRSPHGQISHREVARLTRYSKALVHLKSVDCPGWALYEALLSGCPVVTPRLLNSRMLAYDLLQHKVTCYEFGVPAELEYGRGSMDYPKCLYDIQKALEDLSNPVINRKIGEAGRRRLNALMWSANNPDHVSSFQKFMGRHFG